MIPPPAPANPFIRASDMISVYLPPLLIEIKRSLSVMMACVDGGASSPSPPMVTLTSCYVSAGLVHSKRTTR